LGHPARSKSVPLARLNQLSSLWNSRNRPLHKNSRNKPLLKNSLNSKKPLLKNSHSSKKPLFRNSQLNSSLHQRQLLPVKPTLSSQVTPSTRSLLNKVSKVVGKQSSNSTPIRSLIQH